jgi:hypothetical protein
MQRKKPQKNQTENQQESVTAFEKQLLEILYRSHCPEPEQLLNFQWGLLSSEETALVAVHLAECELCTSEAEELSKLETTITPPASTPFTTQLQQLAQHFIAQLVPPTLSTAVFRATTDPSHPQSTEPDQAINIFTVTELGWDIFVTHWPEPGMKCSLQGQLLGLSPLELATIQVSLIQENSIVATTSSSQAGIFTFANIPYGLYSLSIVKDKETVTIPNLILEQ